MQRTTSIPATLPNDIREILSNSASYVPPQALQLLEHLAAHHERPISAYDLADTLCTSIDGVRVLVWSLRKALGDNHHQPRYIRTEPQRAVRLRYGYQYIGPLAGHEEVA